MDRYACYITHIYIYTCIWSKSWDLNPSNLQGCFFSAMEWPIPPAQVRGRVSQSHSATCYLKIVHCAAWHSCTMKLGDGGGFLRQSIRVDHGFGNDLSPIFDISNPTWNDPNGSEWTEFFGNELDALTRSSSHVAWLGCCYPYEWLQI